MTRNLYESLKVDIIEKCRLLEKTGYFISTWGNISIRVPEGFIVTPSRIPYSELQPDDLVVVSPKGEVIEGHRLPSSEAELHRAVLNKRQDVGAIIHSHSGYSTALACLNLPIPPIVEDLVQIIGGQVNCTRYVPAGQHLKLAEEAANRIGDSNAVLLANHGVICCGRDLEEAYVANQIVEKAAMIMLVAGSRGTVVSIPEDAVQSERHRYLYKYGTAQDKP